MKRRAKHFTWEYLKDKLGLEKVYIAQILDDGIKFHEYSGDIEHFEGTVNMINNDCYEKDGDFDSIDNPKISAECMLKRRK